MNVFLIAAIVIATAFCTLLLLLKGPSRTVSDFLVTTLMETRRGKYVARLFLSEDDLQSALARNQIEETPFVTAGIDEDYDIPSSEKDHIDVVSVDSQLYHGKLMIIRDPSRVTLGVNTTLSGNNSGSLLVDDYVSQLNGIAGINAGGFDDPNGTGDGTVPYGVTIQNGKIVSGSADDWQTLIGFNSHHHLMVGQMTAAQALSYGIENAVTFGPALIVNSAAVSVTGAGGGLNPRTVIGQREDGAVLLLVIEGRKPSSLGATYQDCINIMLAHGAVNAANLDGGGCSAMVYQGKTIASSVSLFGNDRKVPTAWVIK